MNKKDDKMSSGGMNQGDDKMSSGGMNQGDDKMSSGGMNQGDDKMSSGGMNQGDDKMSSGGMNQGDDKMSSGGMNQGDDKMSSGGMNQGDDKMSHGDGDQGNMEMPGRDTGHGDGDKLTLDKMPATRTCGTMEAHRRLLSRDPAYAKARAQIENLALLYEKGLKSIERPGITRIPVVVHVVWNTPVQNISDAQIFSQIDVLNRDFRRTNADVANTPAPFLPLASDARIEFFLANTDPNGAPTSGINRRQTNVTSFSSNDAVKSQATGGIDAWPADRYLNIWVCQLAGGLLGYAQFPGGPAATDGVVIRHSAFGTTGTAARTISSWPNGNP